MSGPVGLPNPSLPARAYPPAVRARLEPDAKEIIARYPQPHSALLPLLHLVQAEEGYVTPAGIAFCAELLELTTAEVSAVVTFYTMYKRHPIGDYHVGVCTNTLCAVMGGDAIFADLKRHLGVDNDGTTPDGKVTLEHIECNAACDYAPVIMVNWEFFDNQTLESARALVDDLRAGREAVPTRGARLCTFRETARVLAGLPDPRPEAVHEGGSGGDASLVGLRIARGRPLPELPRTGQGASADAASAEPPAPEVASADGDTLSATAEHPSSHDAPMTTAESQPLEDES